MFAAVIIGVGGQGAFSGVGLARIWMSEHCAYISGLLLDTWRAYQSQRSTALPARSQEGSLSWNRSLLRCLQSGMFAILNHIICKSGASTS